MWVALQKCTKIPYNILMLEWPAQPLYNSWLWNGMSSHSKWLHMGSSTSFDLDLLFRNKIIIWGHWFFFSSKKFWGKRNSETWRKHPVKKSSLIILPKLKYIFHAFSLLKYLSHVPNYLLDCHGFSYSVRILSSQNSKLFFTCGLHSLLYFIADPVFTI